MKRLLAAAALAVLTACGGSSLPAGPAPFGGQAPHTCYALEYTGSNTALFPVKIGIVGTRGWVVGAPSADGRPSWPMFRHGGAQRPVPGDSAEVTFSSGRSALVLRLHADGDLLAGEAWTESDFMIDPPLPRARVLGHRIRCGPAEAW